MRHSRYEAISVGVIDDRIVVVTKKGSAKHLYMPKFREMDDKTTLAAQSEHESGPVVLINIFTVESEFAQEFLTIWAKDAALMKRQPGFVSCQMHKGIGDSRLFVNYAIWESVADFTRAVNRPEFRASTQRFPPTVTASPHLFQKIAVPGICGAD